MSDFWSAQNIIVSDYQVDANPKKFANDWASVHAIRLLRRSHSIFHHFIGCKDSHFSQISQANGQKSYFCEVYSQPHKKLQITKLSKWATCKNTIFRKCFCINKSKNAQTKCKVQAYTTAIFTGSLFFTVSRIFHLLSLSNSCIVTPSIQPIATFSFTMFHAL